MKLAFLTFALANGEKHPLHSLNQLGVLVERLFLSYDLRDAVPNWESSVDQFQQYCDLLAIDFKRCCLHRQRCNEEVYNVLVEAYSDDERYELTTQRMVHTLATAYRKWSDHYLVRCSGQKKQLVKRIQNWNNEIQSHFPETYEQLLINWN